MLFVLTQINRRKRDYSGLFLLPNQGSNLDFTDPESVVLPITPLGIVIGCKNTLFLNVATKSEEIFFDFFDGTEMLALQKSHFQYLLNRVPQLYDSMKVTKSLQLRSESIREIPKGKHSALTSTLMACTLVRDLAMSKLRPNEA